MRTFLWVLLAIPACKASVADSDDTDLAGDTDTGDTDVPVIDDDGDGWAADVDCDDTDPDVHPGLDELCDGQDQDCDGLVDEDAPDGFEWFPDADGDGAGAEGVDPVLSCDTAVEGYVSTAGDCDDENPEIRPRADELCNLVDDDCDGVIDGEGLVTVFAADAPFPFGGTDVFDLQDAVDHWEADGGRITVCSGTYDGFHADSGTFVIEGLYTADDAVLVSPSFSEDSAVRVGSRTLEIPLDLTLRNVTITGNRVGVEAFGYHTTVRLDTCDLVDNPQSAVLLEDWPTLDAQSTRFRDNGGASIWGAAIGASDGSRPVVTGTDLTFQGNEAADKYGVVYTAGGTLSIDGCAFRDNSAAGSEPLTDVSGIRAIEALTLTDCAFESNTGGAAVFLANEAPATLTDTTFSGNESAYGALYVFYGSDVAMTGGALDGNEAFEPYGAAIHVRAEPGQTVTLTDVDLGDNDPYDLNVYVTSGTNAPYDGSGVTSLTCTEAGCG